MYVSRMNDLQLRATVLEVRSLMAGATSILFGKTRQAVLMTLFDQPEKAWYLRELSRRTGISSGALQQELMQLCAADLLVRRQDGNRVLYCANTVHPIFPDLQSIMRKTCGLPALIKAVLQPMASDITYAGLYGSIARGSEHARSDVDLLIVGRISFEQAIRTVTPVEARIGREIGVRLFSPEEFRQKRASGDSFVQGVLRGERVDLLGSIDDA